MHQAAKRNHCWNIFYNKFIFFLITMFEFISKNADIINIDLYYNNVIRILLTPFTKKAGSRENTDTIRVGLRLAFVGSHLCFVIIPEPPFQNVWWITHLNNSQHVMCVFYLPHNLINQQIKCKLRLYICEQNLREITQFIFTSTKYKTNLFNYK